MNLIYALSEALSLSQYILFNKLQKSSSGM